MSDVITTCGGLAAELLGVPWIELCPHPLYRPSKGLPPVGSGLAPGAGLRGRLRDAVLRALSERSVRIGVRQRSAARAGIGLPAADPGPAAPPDRHASRPRGTATGLAGRGRGRRPAALRTDVGGARRPRRRRTGGGGRAVHGHDRHGGLAELALETLIPGQTLPDGSAGGGVEAGRTRRGGADVGDRGPRPPGRASKSTDLVICGGGHGMVSKTLQAGVPMVVVPGGGDQWEIANRLVRQGSAV